MSKSVVSAWGSRLVLVCVLGTLGFARPGNAQSIKVGDDYFDRLMRSTLTEGAQTPGHFAVSAKYAKGGLLSSGLLVEGALFSTDYVRLAGLFGLLWYRYEVEGLAKDENAGGLNQAAGVGVYLLPKSPVRGSLFAGYNLYYGANVPYGAILPEGTATPEFGAETQPFLYLSGSFFEVFEAIASTAFRAGTSERSKTYLQGKLNIRTFEVGAIYDQLESSADEGVVPGGVTPAFYEISAFMKRGFSLSGGALDGYLLAKGGRSFFVDDASTFDTQFNDSKNLFGLLELSAYWMLGVSYSEANGVGWRAGVDYTIPMAKAASGDPEPNPYFDLVGKGVAIELAYQKNYVDNDLFGPRVLPWTVTIGITAK